MDKFGPNKTQYDWFPGKSQNSKKFSAKFKQNPTTSKIIGRCLTFWGLKYPKISQLLLGVKITSKMNSVPSKYSVYRFYRTFWGQNNIKNEISTIKLLRVQVFSKIRQLFKKIALTRGIFNIFWGKNAPRRELEFFST